MKPSAHLAILLDGLQRRLRDAEKGARSRHLPRGVTAGDVRVLRAVVQVGAKGVSAVAKLLGTSQPAATVAIARLEARGLLVRAASSVDARRKQLTLTAKGRQLEQSHATADAAMAEAFLAPLARAERATFVALLAKVVDGADD